LPAPSEEGPAEITLAALARFLRHPTAFFLRERLGILTWDEDDTLSDDEPFALGTLDSYALKAEWLEERLGGRAEAAHAALLRARGDLPEGRFGDLAWQAVADAVAPLADALAPKLAGARPVPVDLAIAGRRLVGNLRRATPQGSCVTRWRRSSRSTCSTPGSSTWRCSRGAEGIGRETQVVARDGTFVLGASTTRPASSPCWYASTTRGCASRCRSFRRPPTTGRQRVDPDKARRKRWIPGRAASSSPARHHAGGRGSRHRIAWGQSRRPFAPRFAALAEVVYGPLLAAGRKGGAR